MRTTSFTMQGKQGKTNLEGDFWYIKCIYQDSILKAKPLQHVGVVLGLGGLVYMAREFKNRPKDMKISVYLIHTRLFVQGTVIGRSIFLWRKSKKFSGVLSLGMLHQMYQRHQSMKPALPNNS